MDRAAHYERINRTLARVDEVNDSLAERAELRRDAGLDADEWHAERERLPAPAPQLPVPARTMDAASSAAWARWCDGRINKRLAAHTDGAIAPICEEIGAVTGKLGRQLRELGERLGASETAVTELLMAQERTIADLQRRLDAMEQRMPPARPRLITGGSSDAA